VRYITSPLLLILLILTTAIAIVPHEVAHRQVARMNGCNSRFVLSFTGFIVTFFINLVMGLIGFGPIIFISGYTSSSCRFFSLSKDLEGKIALAGPLINIIIAILSIILLRFTTGITSIFLILLVTFNSFVAFFNLLPLGQLDGYKIFRWNVVIWSIMFIISIVLIIRIF
ncbi:MAG: hypothetical protein QXO96_03610, partial [Sulfolobales archaeon]